MNNDQNKNRNNNSNKYNNQKKYNNKNRNNKSKQSTDFDKFWQAYAKELAKRNIYNPIKGSTKKNTSFTNYTKEELLTYLQSPTSQEKKLRDASKALYLSSPQYQRLVNYFANLWLWRYIVVPLTYDVSKENKSFTTSYNKALKQIAIWNFNDELSKIALIAVKEGIFYGVSWQAGESFFIQQINPDYCSVSTIEDGTYIFNVDMSKIKEDELDLYPPEFTKMYNNYKATKVKEQTVPSEVCWCIPFDTSDLRAFVPPFVGLMPELLDIETYRSLQQSATEIENYKALLAQIPLNSDSVPSMDWGTVMEYYEHLANALPPQVGAAVTPFKFTDVNFSNNSGIQSVDIVTRTINQFWSNSGTNGSLHGGATNTSGGMKLAITADTNQMLSFLSTIERCINRHLKNLSGSVKFQIKMLPITLYNLDEMTKLYKESATYGIGKSLYAAALGLTPTDISSLNYIETEVIKMDELNPLKSSHTMSSDDVGRPESDDLTDEGEATKEQEKNNN